MFQQCNNKQGNTATTTAEDEDIDILRYNTTILLRIVFVTDAKARGRKGVHGFCPLTNAPTTIAAAGRVRKECTFKPTWLHNARLLLPVYLCIQDGRVNGFGAKDSMNSSMQFASSTAAKDTNSPVGVSKAPQALHSTYSHSFLANAVKAWFGANAFQRLHYKQRFNFV